MNTDARKQEQKASQVLATLREMQKWGFSLIQAKSAKQQPIEDQIEQARAVARQFLDVADEAANGDVDWVAKGIIDISARTAQDGAFISLGRPAKVACLSIPFQKNMNAKIAQEAAIEACNEHIARDGLDVINVETVFKRDFFGRVQPTGLLVWHRVSS